MVLTSPITDFQDFAAVVEEINPVPNISSADVVQDNVGA